MNTDEFRGACLLVVVVAVVITIVLITSLLSAR